MQWGVCIIVYIGLNDDETLFNYVINFSSNVSAVNGAFLKVSGRSKINTQAFFFNFKIFNTSLSYLFFSDTCKFIWCLILAQKPPYYIKNGLVHANKRKIPRDFERSLQFQFSTWKCKNFVTVRPLHHQNPMHSTFSKHSFWPNWTNLPGIELKSKLASCLFSPFVNRVQLLLCYQIFATFSL